MTSMYNSGTPTGVNYVPQSGSRVAEFNTAATSMQYNNTGGYKPSSVLTASNVLGTGNGQSQTTFQQKKMLNLEPEY